jgi:hypothetical protein
LIQGSHDIFLKTVREKIALKGCTGNLVDSIVRRRLGEISRQKLMEPAVSVIFPDFKGI